MTKIKKYIILLSSILLAPILIYWLDFDVNIDNATSYIKKINLTIDWTDLTSKTIVMNWVDGNISVSWNTYIYDDLFVTWIVLSTNSYINWTINIVPWMLWDSTINSNDILDNTINSNDIANSTISSSDILDSTIQSIDIADNSITTTDIADYSITSQKMINSQTYSFWWLNILWWWVEWDINTLNSIIWYNDLFIKSNSTENQNIYYWAIEHKFYTSSTEKLNIKSDWNVIVWPTVANFLPSSIWNWSLKNSLEVNWWILAKWNWNASWWDSASRIWVSKNSSTSTTRWFSADPSNKAAIHQWWVWDRINIDRNWKIWIWTSTPNSILEVNWWILVWYESSWCSASVEWTLRYNNSLKIYEYCDWTSRK